MVSSAKVGQYFLRIQDLLHSLKCIITLAPPKGHLHLQYNMCTPCLPFYFYSFVLKGVDSHSFQPSVLFSKTSCFPRVFGGFLKRFGSLERMELENTSRLLEYRGWTKSIPLPFAEKQNKKQNLERMELEGSPRISLPHGHGSKSCTPSEHFNPH